MVEMRGFSRRSGKTQRNEAFARFHVGAVVSIIHIRLQATACTTLVAAAAAAATAAADYYY